MYFFLLEKKKGVGPVLLGAFKLTFEDPKVIQRSPICTYISSYLVKVCLITE